MYGRYQRYCELDKQLANNTADFEKLASDHERAVARAGGAEGEGGAEGADGAGGAGGADAIERIQQLLAMAAGMSAAQVRSDQIRSDMSRWRPG